MIKNRSLLKIVLILLVSFLYCLISAIVICFKDASASELSVELETVVKDVYTLNDQFSIPNAEILVEGKRYAVTNSYLVYPDGNAYQRKEYSLNQLGKYKVQFIAESDAGAFTGEKTFRVYGDAYSVTFAGQCVYREQLQMVDPDVAKVGGLGLTLNEGSVFTYNSAFDLTKSDLTVPVVKIYPYTLTQRLNKPTNFIEANCTIVRITDAYDKNNYVDIEISWDASLDGNNQVYYNCYFRAGTSEEQPAGFALNKTGAVSPWWPTITYNGNKYNIHRKPKALSNIYGPYGASGDSTNADNSGFEVYYEYSTKKVYIKDRENLIFVSDLSCKDVYETPFKGFTNGEVYLSVLADYYKENQFNVEISSIYGLNGEELNIAYAKDELPPILYTDVTNTSLGEIIIAQGEKFEIPPVSAKDTGGIKSVGSRVYYAYGTKAQTQISVNDNSFVPQKTGQYTIVYYGEDIYGNVSQRTLELTCKKCENDRALRLSFTKNQDSDLLLLNDAAVDVLAGKKYTLAQYGVESENSFATYVNAYYIYGDDITTRREIDLAVGEIGFYKIGRYKVVYEYGDAVQNKKDVFEVNSCVSDEKTIETPYLPEYFIKNARYSFEYIPVTLYNDESLNYVAPDVYVKFDDADYVKVNSENLKIEADRAIKIQYRYQDTVLYETPSMPVVDVNFGKKLAIQNYFQGDFTAEPNSAEIDFVSNTESGENRLDFINVISFNSFNLAFKIKDGLGNFGSLKIELIDYYDRNKKAELIYGKDGDKAFYRFNGINYNANNFVGANNVFYDISSKGFVLMNGTVIPYLSEFTSDKVILHLTIQDMVGKSGVTISKLNGQNISNRGTDIGNPVITEKQTTGKWNLNEKLTIYRPDVTDVLSPYLNDNFTITVLMPDGETACKDLSSGNILKDYKSSAQTYSIEISQYGNYTILYNYKDQSDNSVTIMSVVVVTDNVSPTFTLDGGYCEKTIVSIKLGNRVNLARFSANDNYTETENLRIMILAITPNFDTVVIDSNDLSYFPQIKGLHTIRYMCVDEAGNYVSVSYKIMVN